MEYKFIRTIQGPAILGEDEVIFFNQFGQMLDYLEEDPEFLPRAKAFVAETLVETAQGIADGLTQAVVGAEYHQSLFGYVQAIDHLKNFEHGFLVSIRNGN